MKTLINITLLFFGFFTPSLAIAQQPTSLSVEYIMRDPNWIGSSPTNPRWSEDGTMIYFSWDENSSGNTGTYAYSIGQKGDPIRLTQEVVNQLPSTNAAKSTDGVFLAYARNGDLFLYNRRQKSTTQLTHTLDRESNPSFDEDNKTLYFEKDNNLFHLSLDQGIITQVTDFRSGIEPTPSTPSEQEAWLAKDNEALIQYVADQQSSSEENTTTEDKERPTPIYLGRQSAFNLQVSPNGRFVTYLKGSFGQGTRTEMPNYLASSGYVAMESARPKVGSPQSSVSLWVYDTEKGQAYPVSTDSLPGRNDAPAYFQDYNRLTEEHKRSVSFAYSGVSWSPDGAIAVTQVYSNDYKDRWIVQINLVNGSLTTIDRQRDEAWIAGPGIGWFSNGLIGWLPKSHTLWYLSEASGYAHLYSHDLDKNKTKQLTEGDFEVYTPQIDAQGKYFYFAANVEHPGIRNVYRVPLKGGKIEAITSLSGGIEFSLSPTGNQIAFRHSTASQPWELFWQRVKPNSEALQITASITDEFKSYPWRTPEYKSFMARDGALVHSRLYRPENPSPQGPAVIFVHGAGYLQNAHQWWSSYFREYMFHNLLVEKGYTVLDIDYRASAGYGRNWRTGIYRHMGGKDLTDHIDGAQWLVDEYQIDPARIGIYGGSYGGFITLMALFTQPEIFACGAALRSVTDWAHYNHGYTANILNTPVSDSLAYRRSSPIYYADGLQKPLLMCHGVLDDNVQFQDIVRLSQVLIEKGKEDWELAIYPAEPHSFVRPDSWTDEYKRILALFEEYLKQE